MHTGETPIVEVVNNDTYVVLTTKFYFNPSAFEDNVDLKYIKETGGNLIALSDGLCKGCTNLEYFWTNATSFLTSPDVFNGCVNIDFDKCNLDGISPMAGN